MRDFRELTRRARGVAVNVLARSPWWSPRTRAAIWRLLGASVGRGVGIYPYFIIVNNLDQIYIGDDVFVNTGVTFGSNAPIRINADVAIGPGCSFLPTSHRFGPSGRRAGEIVAREIVIERGAWLGANVTVLGGVRIGEGSVVGAGSVVTMDVPPNVVVAGVPASFVRKLSQDQS